MKKIFITGATGFIGKNLIENLKGKNYFITCLVRKISNKKDIDFLLKNNAKIIYGDILNIKSLIKPIKQADTIIHIAGILGSFNRKENDYININITGTKNIVNECNKYKNKKRLIYCSSAGVLGNIINGNENSIPNPTNIYEKTKLDAEKIVKKYSNYIILRPEFLYGKYDNHVLNLFNSIKKKHFFLIGKGNSLLHPTYIDDLINIIEKIIENKDIKNETFIIAGNNIISVRDFYLLICKYFNIKPNKLNIPYFLAKLYVLIIEKIALKFNFHPILTKSRLYFFTKSRSFNISKAKKILNYNPIDLEIGLEKTIKWYKQKKLL